MEVREQVSIEDIRRAKPDMIFYGANTCWWTHDPAHLSRTTGGRLEGGHKIQLPSDPRGGVLFQTDNIEAFLKAAEEDAGHYGRHGLRAFMAAHHGNSFKSLDDPIPWCAPTWDEYNNAIDRLDRRKVANN
ncbi:MAG: hypothetical protein ACREAB_07210 [Blastocatellia bacterium]